MMQQNAKFEEGAETRDGGSGGTGRVAWNHIWQVKEISKTIAS